MIWPLMIKIKCWCFCWKNAQNAKKIKKNATCAKYAKFAKPNLPKQSYHTIPKKQNMPNKSKPNLANQTYQAKSTRWPTNMDFFLLISRICDHWICIVRWKRLHVLRRGFVIFKIIDWIKAVNAWVRGAFYVIFQIGVVVTLIVLCCLSRRNKKRQQGFVIIFSCPSSSLPT